MRSGAGSGIGRAACAVLANEGARIVACDLNYDSAKSTVSFITGHNHSAWKLDVSQKSEVSSVLSDVVKKYEQPPCVIVNCAGIKKDNFVMKMSESDFDHVLEVNLKGTYLVVQQCSKLLIEYNLRGSVINISSIIAKLGNIGQCNYAASKAGVEVMTKTAAMEFGKYGIRCNCILPGFIKTPMVDSVPDAIKELFKKRIALGRLGEPEEVAEVILFLASDRSSYINGASIEVTGGGL